MASMFYPEARWVVADNRDVNATEVGQLSTKQKVYLRGLPIDPMTGKSDWELRSRTTRPTPVRGAVKMFLMCAQSRKTRH